MTKVLQSFKSRPGGLQGTESFDSQDKQGRLWKTSPEDISEYVKTDLNIEPYKTVKTVKKTIGNRTVTGVDFNFVTGVNKTEQIIDLGTIIPAYARILDVIVVTNAAFTNLGALSTDVGTTSGGGELIAAADNTALNAFIADNLCKSLKLIKPVKLGACIILALSI